MGASDLVVLTMISRLINSLFLQLVRNLKTDSHRVKQTEICDSSTTY